MAQYALLTLDRATSALQKSATRSGDPQLYIKIAELAYDKAWAFTFPPLADPAKMAVAIDHGVKAADRAIAAAPRSSAAHEIRGLLLFYRWITSAKPTTQVAAARAEAEKSLRIALDEDNRSARAWNALSTILIAKGEFADAYWAAEQGHRADIYLEVADALTENLLRASLELGHHAAAAEWCAQITRRSAGGWNAADCKLQLLAAQAAPTRDDLQEVEALLASAASEKENEPVMAVLNAIGAVVFAKAGYIDRASVLLKKSEDGPMSNEAQPFRAWAMQYLGDRAAARTIITSYVRQNPTVRAGLRRSARYADLY
jgi:hypothetical protein